MSKGFAGTFLIVMMATGVSFEATLPAQETVNTISIQSRDKSVRQALEEISRKAAVGFIFEDALIEDKTVTCDIRHATVLDILEKILTQTGIGFRQIQDGRFVLYSASSPEQRCTITGRVTDAKTGEPLYYANVFLHNTTLGAATDRQGRFIIENVPTNLGNYELVVRMVGYRLVTEKIKIQPEGENVFYFALEQEPIEAPVLTVTAEFLKEWKKNLKKFETLFLGTSSNARRSTLVNPEVLDFAFNEEKQTFYATNAKPLELQNRALGYTIHVDLVDFRFVEYKQGLYNIYKAHFEPLKPKNERESDRWRKNRLKAYHGSPRHFFTSLMADSLEQEGFTMYCRRLKDSNVTMEKGRPEDVLYLGHQPYEDLLVFNGDLCIVYEKEGLPAEYRTQKAMKNETSSSNRLLNRLKLQHPNVFQDNDVWVLTGTGIRSQKGQISRLKLNKNGVIVNASGHVYDPYAMSMLGYWAWERFADELPLDYKPGT